MADQKLRIDILGNAKGLNNSLKSASKSLKSFGQQTSQLGKNLALRVTAPLALAGGAAIKFATDTEESLNKVRVAFGNSSGEVEDFAKTSLESFGIARSTALDMTALFGDMATGMGINTSEAAGLSTSLVGLAGDLSSFKNINISEVTTALSGVFTGETESLKRLGIVMTQTNLAQFALNKGIKTQIKDMTQAEKISLRFQYVMQATANAQGDFARTSEGAANQGRILQESLKELAASFGEVLLPVFTKILTKLNGVVKVFKNLDPRTKKVVVVIGLLAAAIPPLLIVVGSLATAFAALNVATGVIGAAIIALTAIVGNVVAYQSLKNEIKGVEKSLPDLRKEVDKAKESFDGSAESSLNLYKAQRKLLKSELDLLKLQQDKEQGTIAKLLGIESEAYKELGEKIKQTENKIKNYDLSIKGVESSQTQVSTSTKKMHSGFVKLSELEFGDEFEKQMEKLLKAEKKAADLQELEDIKVGMGIDGTQEGLFDVSSIQEASEALDELEDMGAMDDLSSLLDPLEPKLDSFIEKQKKLAEISSQVTQIVQSGFQNMAMGIGESLGQAIAGGGNFAHSMAKTLLEGVGAIAMQLGQLAIGVGITIKGIKQALQSLNPIAAIAAGIALIALGSLAKSAAANIGGGGGDVPALANGGIVSAPTLAMVGDNVGAGNGNPEVIAPLDKLQGMMASNPSNQNVNVGGSFKVQGQDLVVALQRANKNRDRL